MDRRKFKTSVIKDTGGTRFQTDDRQNQGVTV